MKDSHYPYQHIYERDAFTCQFCDWRGSERFEHWWVAGFAVTHIKPPGHGGTDDDDNLVLGCHACTQHKGDADCETLEDARRLVAANRAHAQAWFAQHILPEGPAP